MDKKDNAQDANQQVLRFGDVVLLQCVEHNGFVSCTPQLSPNVRVNQLSPGISSPLDVTACMLEVRQRYQYTERRALDAVLQHQGLSLEDINAQTNANRLENSKTFNQDLMRRLSQKVMSFRRPSAGGMDLSKLGRNLAHLYEAYLKERAVNNDEFVRMVGQQVLYGQVVQLRDTTTGKFLTIKRTAAEVERGALKVMLEDGGNTGSWFTVMSGYSTKVEGDKVLFDEVISLSSATFSGMRLHLSVNSIVQPQMMPVRRHRYLLEAHEIAASPDAVRVKLIPHSLHPSQAPECAELLCGCVAVTIVHKISGNLLVVHNEQVYFSEAMADGDDGETVIPGIAVWRIEPVDLSWMGMPFDYNREFRMRNIVSGMYLASPKWVIGEDPGKAATFKSATGALVGLGTVGAITGSSSFRANVEGASRPMTPLAIDGRPPTIPEVPEPTGDSPPESPEVPSPIAPKTSASMAKARNNEAELALQDSYQSTNLQVMFDYEHEACKWKLNTFVKDVDASLLKSSFAFIRHTRDQWMGQGAPVRVAGLEGTFYHPRISGQREDRNVMAINAIAPEFVISVEAVGAVLITMKTFAKQLQANPCKATEDMDAEQIASAVKDPAFLNVFREFSYRASALLNKMIEEMDKSRPRVNLEAAMMYQTLCRECRVLCAIVDCLAAIPYKALFKVNLKSAPTSLQNLVSFGALCHKFFQVSCMGNAENQRFLLRHLDVITKHLGGPLKAADTLAAMYDNNMELIQNIDETIICQFIGLVKTSGRRPRFVNFLHKVCGSKDRPVPQNQNWIIDTLKERPRDLLIQARVEQRPTPNGLQDVLVLKADREVLCGRFAGIQDDKKHASVFTWDRTELRLETDPDYTLFLYYLFSLHLVCSLCYGRNNHARDTLLSLSAQHGLGYEFDMLLSVATNINMPNVARSTMLQLIQNMYVDVDPHTRVLLPRLTRLLTLDNGERQLKLKVATREVAVQLSSNMETLTQHVVAMLAYMEVLMDSRLVPDRKNGPKRMAVGFDEPDCGLSPGEVALAHEVVKVLHMLMTLGILTLDLKAAGDALKVLERLTRKLNSPEDLDADIGSKRPGKTQVGNDVVVDMKSSILALFEFSLDMWRDSVISIIFDWFVTFMKTQGDESAGAATNLPNSALQPGLGRDGGQPAGLPRIRSALQRRKVQKVAPQAAGGGRAGPAASAEAEEVGEAEPLLLSDPSLPLCVLKALKRCVERAAVEMQSRTVFHGFELFEFDVLKLEQMKGPLMTVLPLCRYQSVALASKAFELVERMVSKRRKLIQALMNTHIVCDSQSILMYHRASWILKDLMFHYKYVASSDPEERKRCIEQCISHVEELTTMVTPQQVLKVEVEVQDELDDDMQSLFISGTRAQNFQIVLYDLRAHESILSFLKLPLRTFHPRPTSSDPKPMRTAKDDGRRQLFGVCYKFLMHFCVCTDGVGSLKWGLPNRKNQEALYRHLPLFLGHVGIKALNVANTVSAILVKNLELASNIGHKIIHQFVQNIVDYGQKKRARWLDFLRSVAVIDGKPMKNNQAAILQYAADYEAEFCHFFQTPEEKEHRWKLLAEKNHELDENGADAQPSELKYHRACLLLFADCCTGKETTFIVKASGFVKFDEVVKTIMMKPKPPVSGSDVRFVTTAYWTFLQYVYFSTDTENTKEAVRAANNGIWPSHGEEEAGVAPAAPSNGGCCLIQTVIDELKEAVNEPRNALQQFYSASSTLPTFVWPALQEYFANHYLQHAARLPEEHVAMCWDLGECMYDYLDAIRAVDVQQYGVKHQKKAAAKATKAMLATLRAAGLIEHRAGKIADYGDASSYGGGGSVDAPTTATAISTKLIGKHWELFYTQLGLIAGLRVIPERSECYEFSRTLRDCNDNEIRYMGAFMLARVLAQPFGASIPDSNPPMSYDRVLERLSNLMRTLRDTSWPEELTVRMLKSVRGAILIDDGKASEMAWKSGWPRLMANDPPASEDEGMVVWVQQKYNLLGWTAAAVKLVCSMSPFVRMEGIEMLICLLEGGSSVVQDTLHSLVSDGSPLSVAFLTTLRDTLSSCAEHVRTSGRTLLKKRRGPKQDLESNPLAAASLAPAVKMQEPDSTESNAQGDGHGGSGHEDEETIKADGTDRELSTKTLPPLLPGPGEKAPLAADGPDASEAEDEEDDDDDGGSQEQEEEEEEEVFLERRAKLNDGDDVLHMCKRVLWCMKLMCEGHHSNMQMILNVQPAHKSNIDLLAEAVQLLGVLQTYLIESLSKRNQVIPDLMIGILQFLQELVQGPCSCNQVALAVHTTLFLLCNRIFVYVDYRIGRGSARSRGSRCADVPEDPVVETKATIKINLLVLLYSLLEGVDAGSVIPTRMVEVLDFHAFESQMKRLALILNLRGTTGVPQHVHACVLPMLKSELLQFLSFLKKLAVLASENSVRNLALLQLLMSEEIKPESMLELRSLNMTIAQDIFTFMQSSMASVELMWDGRLERVYFELPPDCMDLNANAKWRDTVMEFVKGIDPDTRINPVLKGLELVSVMRGLVKDIRIDSAYRRNSASRWISQLNTYRDKCEEMSTYISLINLVLLTLTYGGSHDRWRDRHPWAFFVILASCVLQLTLLTALAVVYYSYDFTKWMHETWPERREFLAELLGFNSRSTRREDDGEEEESPAAVNRPTADARVVPTNDTGAPPSEVPPPPELTSSVKRHEALTRILLLALFWKTWFTLILMGGTLLAMTFSPFFSTLHLTYFFTQFEAGNMLMTAMGKSGGNIVKTGVLAAMAILLFAVGSFLMFDDRIPDTDDQVDACHTLYQCVGKMFVAGIYGDISTIWSEAPADSVPDDPQDKIYMQWRTVWWLLFFILWTFVLSNIFTGQVVDAFTAIREDKNTVREDSETRCLVCSLDRFTFDQHTHNGFFHHTQFEHNPLAYIYYLCQLEDKDPDEFTGYDSAVQRALESDSSADWLPIGRALVLEHVTKAGAEAKETSARNLEQLQASVKQLHQLREGDQQQQARIMRLLEGVHQKLQSM